jgi:hypothetical protein
VALAHDADQDGDAGADKAAKVIGDRTIRLRPPEGFKDWCAWPGEKAEFLELTGAARSELAAPVFLPAGKFLEVSYPAAEPLLGEPSTILYLTRGSLLLVYGDGGAGKSTLSVDAPAHLAAGRDWLGIPVPRPVRVLMIENERAAALFQQKLRDKGEQWGDAEPGWLANVYVYAEPWGSFSFAKAEARAQLLEFCDDQAIDVVFGNPLFGLGGPGSGRPE